MKFGFGPGIKMGRSLNFSNDAYQFLKIAIGLKITLVYFNPIIRK